MKLKTNMYITKKIHETFKILAQDKKIKSASSFCDKSMLNYLLTKSTHKNICLHPTFMWTCLLSEDVVIYDTNSISKTGTKIYCLHIGKKDVKFGTFKECAKYFYLELKEK